ncbi:MAG: thioredoxin [Haloarculaceae archaeon]
MTEDIEEIRRQKMEELRNQAGEGGDGSDSGNGGHGRSPAEPVHVDGRADLEGFVADHGVVLADFYADWCGPCQMLEPVVESVAAETDAAVAKVDVDANQGLAAEYGVQGVPTLVLFADGEPAERLVGMQEERRLRSLVESHA